MSLDAQYWNERWLHDQTGWDMHAVSPPLQAYFTQLHDKDRSILIPGCGNAYEAAWLLDHGFTSITLIDISETLTNRLRQQFPTISIITGDFFQHTGRYDLIIEQTFFCALDPALRESYVTHMHSLLNPGGTLAGLLFDRDFGGPDGSSGPPFGGHAPEYHKLLEKKFKIKTLAPCYNSIPARAGTELFFIASAALL